MDAPRAISFALGNGEVRASYSIGQEIFTPSDTKLMDPPRTERPYAGFLWAGLALLTKDDRSLNQLQVQLGVIGPASLAQNAQDFVHNIINDAKPQGWHYQLHDEPALQFAYERAFKIIPP